MDIDGDVDLNTVTDLELRMAKQRMDEQFLQNRVLPGDPEFEYDKQVRGCGLSNMHVSDL